MTKAKKNSYYVLKLPNGNFYSLSYGDKGSPYVRTAFNFPDPLPEDWRVQTAMACHQKSVVMPNGLYPVLIRTMVDE